MAQIKQQAQEQVARMQAEMEVSLKEKEIMPIKENMEPALREHMGKFVPKDKRKILNN